MKKIVAFLTAAGMMFSLAGCLGDADNSDNKNEDATEATEIAEATTLDVMQIEVENVYESERYGYEVLYEYEFEKLYLSDDDAKRYPKLSASLDEMNRSNHNYFETNAADNYSAAYEDYMNNDYFSFYYDEMYYNVVRADEIVFSAMETNVGYWGGAHPNSIHAGVNIDPLTGKELTLDDVSSDRETLEKTIYDVLTAKYDDVVFFNLEEDLQQYIDEDYLEWTIGYQGITFYFPPYALASYADGLLTAEIMFCDYPELFNDRYMEIPEGYAVPLRGLMTFDLDLSDGKTDEILCYTYEDMYEMERVVITVNGMEFEDNYMYSYDTEVYLVHFENDGDNKNYIYVEYVQENDYPTIGIYKIDGNIIRNIDYISGTGFDSCYDGSKITQALLNNPDSFILDTRSDMLSTTSVYREYYIEPDTGKPIAKKDYYIMDVGHTLTSLIDMEVEIVGEDETETVEAGEEFEFVRTDNETYVIMRMSDKRECKLWVDTSHWPYTVNGMDSEECFDGMMYAG